MAKALELTGEVVQDLVCLFWDAVETGDPLHGGGGKGRGRMYLKKSFLKGSRRNFANRDI
ncbi:hypothetical protein OsI_01561 [Oryza sativa Indica Group]|uniref:Uncharacterized protein n=3 Tax=Oryza TaxID=4527 RepID=A2ZS93_ORYSJ|nr:hypothetical protein OsJ_01454 [Oryza sativa Japonica Group]EEC70490.1 hypothetical protein OsI_01561 [Oryza sativa Indica Group]